MWAETGAASSPLPSASPAEVAEVGLDGWEQNKPVVIVGRANAAGAFMTRFAPRAAVARMSATLLRPQGVRTPPSSKAPLGIALGLVAGGLLFQLARHRSE